MSHELTHTFEIESNRLKMTIDAANGARIISLIDLSSGREWMAQTEEVEETTYGTSFTSRVIHGWDEMLPSVDSCEIMNMKIPDHGELWSVPWVTAKPNHPSGLRLLGFCRTSPLILEREIRALNDGSFLMEYNLKNVSSADFPAVWAAHPQFAVSNNARLVVDPTPRFAWISSPFFMRGWRNWEEIQEIVCDLKVGEHLKVWVNDNQSSGSVEILDGNDRIVIAWNGDVIQRLAILWDYCAFSRERIIAIEPATATRESLAEAHSMNECLLLPPKGKASWHIQVSAGDLEE